MAPHADSPVDDGDCLPAPPRPAMSANPPRLLIIGAGSRGNAYARATAESTNGITIAVAEPIAYKRKQLGEKYIWGKAGPAEGQEFEDWRAFLKWELQRREKANRGEDVPVGVDGAFICVLDEQHKEVIVGLAPLGLHIMCEKPLATTLDDCVSIYKSLLPNLPNTTPSTVFSIGHVLRYSPHNMLLRKLLLEEKIIGEIMSINHTEPVGWWHFTHSYVRYTVHTHAPNIIANRRQRQLAKRIYHSPIPPDQVLSRYRCASLAVVLSTTEFHQTSSHTDDSHLRGISSILQQDSKAYSCWKCHQLPFLSH
jgi:hypothetical protein